MTWRFYPALAQLQRRLASVRVLIGIGAASAPVSDRDQE
jgi:hypothetical protein